MCACVCTKCVRAGVCMCVYVCACKCVCVSLYVCMWVRVWVFNGRGSICVPALWQSQWAAFCAPICVAPTATTNLPSHSPAQPIA